MSSVLNQANAEQFIEFLRQIVECGVAFKLQPQVQSRPVSDDLIVSLITPLPEVGRPLDQILEDFRTQILPACTNFSSQNFIGFPDAGNSLGGLAGAVLSDFLQQNLINQSFCAPSATFVEIAVVRWLREIVGYSNPNKYLHALDAGGFVTFGGTISNTIALMLARENHSKNTMKNGVSSPERFKLVVPVGIGHYSVKSAQMWLGCGSHLLEVKTKNFRYDLDALRETIRDHPNEIMGVVAYAGDSRTMTIDRLRAVHDTVRAEDEKVWLHADACHGFCCGLSDRLRSKISGLELFDSISMDPHKVLALPYPMSALLVRDSKTLDTIISISDLIMSEQFAFGQITPMIGTKSWMSLKLWFAVQHLGRQGLGSLIEARHDLAVYLERCILQDNEFCLISGVDLNAVTFMYVGSLRHDLSANLEPINDLNKKIHSRCLRDGRFHVHQFGLPDPGVIRKDATIFPLRAMPGNYNTTKADMDALLVAIKEYVWEAPDE